MKLKAFEILNIYDSFSKIADKELCLNAACLIAKNMKELSTAKEIIDTKRNIIISEYAEKDEKENIRQTDDGSVKILDVSGFNGKLNELLEEETSISITPIPKKELSDIKVSPKTVLVLEEKNLLSED